MLKKKISKVVGIKKEEFDQYIESSQAYAQEARLIPTYKTGDEMALTSIFLSSLRLVKEFRDSVFKDIKLSRSSNMFYYTEVSFPDISDMRFDGLILIVVSGKITDAAIFEMKNKSNKLDQKQIEAYIELAKKLGIKKLVTVSNQFVADPSHSPLKIKTNKSFGLYHFSWTYLLTKGQLLLFKNDINIKDEDQIEIMREALEYLENPVSGVSGFAQMRSGWKELVDNIRANNKPKATDQYVEDAVVSWYEEEKDMALMLSRRLGILVKSTKRGHDSIRGDINRILKDSIIRGSIQIKDSVSDIRLVADFNTRIVSMSIKVDPPLNKGTAARITWINKQMKRCESRSPEIFKKLNSEIWIESNIKFARDNIKTQLVRLDELSDESKGKEIQSFNIVLMRSFGVKFSSNKGFVLEIERMILEYYEGVVQHMANWKRPAPKIIN